MSEKTISVFVVDDSPVARELLLRILGADPEIRILGCAVTGEHAIARLAELKPDVVTMDIHLPDLDGFEVTRRIMETQPVPIVIVSANYHEADVEKTFQAIEAGAVAAVEKPRGPLDPGHERAARKLVQTVKSMSEVRVIKRWARARKSAREVPAVVAPIEVKAIAAKIQVVAIGASTGGPPVLQKILAALPKPFPVPLLIVQHISAGFIQGLADWLTKVTAMRVRLAQDGERLEAGCAYLAPDGCQMRAAEGGRLTCAADPPESGLRPAVSCLFRSVAEVYGERAIGVLLTGMGRDGADELRLMRDRGAVTIVQDKESSIVYGMPGEAVKIGAAVYVFPPEQIAATLKTLVCDMLLGFESNAR